MAARGGRSVHSVNYCFARPKREEDKNSIKTTRTAACIKNNPPPVLPQRIRTAVCTMFSFPLNASDEHNDVYSSTDRLAAPLSKPNYVTHGILEGTFSLRLRLNLHTKVSCVTYFGYDRGTVIDRYCCKHRCARKKKEEKKRGKKETLSRPPYRCREHISSALTQRMRVSDI